MSRVSLAIVATLVVAPVEVNAVSMSCSNANRQGLTLTWGGNYTVNAGETVLGIGGQYKPTGTANPWNTVPGTWGNNLWGAQATVPPGVDVRGVMEYWENSKRHVAYSGALNNQ